ncbi:hypothetical protein ACH5RR_018241 [Cinchona calisaya]|uniref:Reverse transcriptase domain-containing protein n=1 Tax=Cinchona calisaya TaxID=153742 RepID=A0ABD2ZKX1_9GENT
MISPLLCNLPGCQATNNIIILQEVIHSLKHQKGRRGSMIAKMDLEKACDRISRHFHEDTVILKTVGQLGLPDHEIYDFVQPPVLWNGAKSQAFKPTEDYSKEIHSARTPFSSSWSI